MTENEVPSPAGVDVNAARAQVAGALIVVPQLEVREAAEQALAALVAALETAQADVAKLQARLRANHDDVRRASERAEAAFRERDTAVGELARVREALRQGPCFQFDNADCLERRKRGEPVARGLCPRCAALVGEGEQGACEHEWDDGPGEHECRKCGASEQ